MTHFSEMESNNCEEIVDKDLTVDVVTGEENEREVEGLHDVDAVKCIDLQYFHVQDAHNEIIVTTDGDVEDDYDGQYMEGMEDNSFCADVESMVDKKNTQVEEPNEHIREREDNVDRKGQVFILPTLDDIKELIRCYCEQTQCRFVGQIKTKDFGLSSLECDLSGHRILWQDIPHKNKADDIITFDGIPHMCVGHYQFGCEFGTDLKAARKEKLQKMKEDGKSEVKTRNVKTPSKKCGCPAKIVVRQIIKFPEFQILKNTEGRKRTGTTKLKESLKNDRGKVKTEVLYVGRLPDILEHKFHELMEGREFSKEMVHPELVIKAQELFLQSKSNLEIYEQIRSYVLNEMFWKKDPPDPKRRRFFPKPIDIRNIVGRIRRLSRFTEEEEETIRTYIEDTRKKFEDASIFFDINENNSLELLENSLGAENAPHLPDSIQPMIKKEKKDIKSQQTFIFCYQTHSQQWLIKRYNYLCYLVELEACEPDMKCALPYGMYCLLVQTNVDYQAVGVIIVSKQRKYGLIEGLRCFREWNFSWDPDYFLIDYSEEIEEAIATVFPKATYFLNPHSCKKKWLQFLNTPSNDLQGHSEELAVCLESMQYALTEESLTVFASLLESNEVWKMNDSLRTWFQTSWLHTANKWVFGYRPDDLLVMQHMKISLDDCIATYKSALGKSAKTNGFFELIQEIINVTTLKEYEKYCRRNSEVHMFHKQLEKKYTFPEYMQGLQVSLYPYVEGILKVAKSNDFIITHDQLGLFTVQLQQPTTEKSNAEQTNAEQTNAEQTNGQRGEANNERAKNNGTDHAFGEKKEVISTKFSYIEYASKLDTGEFTVSFGDSRSHPFCTCTHWKFYKLPCVHICAVCCRLRGWRYQMFSPLYRSNPIFDVDYTCLSNDFLKNDHDVDSLYNNLVLDVTGNIFESFMKVGANDVVLDQTNEFLRLMTKMTYIFKDRSLYTKIHHQLTDFVERLKTFLLTKGTNDKLQIPLSTLQSRSDFVALSIVNNLKVNNKPVLSDRSRGGTSEIEAVVPWSGKINNDFALPRLQPISKKDDQSKYIICTPLENSKSTEKALDLINFNIKSAVVSKDTISSSSQPHPSCSGSVSTTSLDSKNVKIPGVNGVHSVLLGKRISSVIDSCATKDAKRVKACQTEDGAPSTTPEQISIRNNFSKEEAVVELT